ncbi:ribosome small subunit-dependent GTPase A [Paenibacillus terrigena]|uniref:ribosome small subunit-dependent GTPase A n=1 Tax=Paenibacillus terrigena TaxID=369333 RepID=UPI0037C7A90A
MTFHLQQLGFNPSIQTAFESFASLGYQAARVALEHTHLYTLYSEHGELIGEVSGKYRYGALGRGDYPAVGDWVAISARPEDGRATIHAVLPRFSKFSRKVAGSTTDEQIVATNINTVFLVVALNNDFNVRRVERYLIMAWESGANPVIILSKADLCDDPEAKAVELESVAIGVPVHIVSTVSETGFNELKPYLAEGMTIALLGSSGVGKSSIINQMLGTESQKVQGVREGDDRGRHTTTHRELFILPDGALMIDTPGMRELQLWDADEGFSSSFQDVESLTEQCFYSDCQHQEEPRCAVRMALENGSLEQGRYDNYNKMKAELAYLARKEDAKLRQQEKLKWKQITKSMRSSHKSR